MKVDPEEVQSEVDSLLQFDPEILPEHFSCAIYGQRRTGKTTILRDLIYQLRDRFDIVIVFSVTADLYKTTDYSFVPENNFVYGLDEKFIEGMITKRRNYILQGHDKKKLDRMLFLLDDVISEKNVFHSKTLSSLFVLGRHALISVVVLTQHTSGINPTIRKNLDLSIVFYPESSASREVISKEYLSLKHWNLGSEILKAATNKQFATLAIIRNPSARAYNEKAFTYMARYHEKKFKIRGIVRQSAGGDHDITCIKKFNITFNIHD